MLYFKSLASDRTLLKCKTIALNYPQSAMMEKKDNAIGGITAQALMRLAQGVLMGPADVLMTQIETTAHALVSKMISAAR